MIKKIIRFISKRIFLRKKKLTFTFFVVLFLAVSAGIISIQISKHNKAFPIISYQQVKTDPQIKTIIDSSRLVNGNLIVKFHHSSNKEEPVTVIGDVNYELSKTIAKPEEVITLTVFNWNNKYFKLKVGSASDVFEFGEKHITELVENRTENSKTFDLGNGKRALEVSIGTIHYKDNYADPDEQWKDIDLTWEGNRITKAPYELTLDGQKLTLRDKKTGEVSTIELLESKPAGIKWQIVPEYTRVRFQHTLLSDKVPFEVKFKVTGKVPFMTQAFDDNGDLPLETTFNDGILTEKLSSLPRVAKGSIRVDPTWQVGASTDDACRGGEADPWNLTTGGLQIGSWYTPQEYYGNGMRFTNITIPQGTIILDGTYLIVRSAENRAGTVVRSRISAEDVDDAPTFADSAAAFDARWATRTTARVDWDSIPAWTAGVDYNSPEIKTVIKEIVDRALWVSGNDIVIFWDDLEKRSDNAAYRSAYSWNSSTTYAPQLVVTYSAIVAPTVTTQAATSVEATTATGNGNITATGGENDTRRGFAYMVGTSGDPTTANSVAYDDGSFGTGAYTKGLTGLSTGTSYRVRAYAVNSAGTGYGTTVQILTKPAAPTNVAATDGTYTDKVTITWTKSTGATGYRVYRGAVDASGLLGDVATYDDTGADAPTITAGTASATDGASTSYVTLSVAGESAANGTTHTYKVVASNTTGVSADSSTDTGYRGTTTLTYQWQRSAADSDASYSNITAGTADPYNDTGAPAPTITAGTASATDGSSPSYVTLSLAGESANVGAGRYFKVTISMTGATPATTAADRGYIGVGSLTYQWQRSAADSDASYSNINGGTTDPYNDTGAPPDGSGRYYECVLNAAGASQQISSSDRGYTGLAPTVTTQRANNITNTTVTGNGNITTIIGENATVRGFKYGLTQTDTWSTTENGSFGIGAFTGNIQGLSQDTIYYYRAYATNPIGTGYGEYQPFTTGYSINFNGVNMEGVNINQ